MTAFPAQQNRNNSVRIVGGGGNNTTRHDRDENNDNTSSSNSRIRFRQQQSSRSAFYHPKLGPTVIAKLVNANSCSSINNNAVSAIIKRRRLDEITTEQQRQQEIATSVAAAAIIEEDNCRWNFRPSALQYDDYGKGNMSITEIIDLYVRDNERATRDGISIPVCPASVASSSPFTTSAVSVAAAAPPASASPSPTSIPSSLRCLQWNIQAFTSPKEERNIHTITTGILKTIFDSNSDVLVLNEIHWRDEDDNSSSSSSSSVSSSFSSSKQEVKCDSQILLEKELCKRGYYFTKIAVHGDTPTMIASRYPVFDYQELILSNNRSALCILIDTTNTGNSGNNNSNSTGTTAAAATATTATNTSGNKCWIVGTHLDAFDAKQRRSEIQIILNNVNKDDTPILLMGDFNQQRLHDYTTDEWNRITDSADRRNIPVDDGVSTILEQNSFHCILDHVRQHGQRHDSHSSDNSGGDGNDNNHIINNNVVQCNWNKNEPPPSTHWSGTTIDYTYYYNHENGKNGNNTNIRIIPHGVYVSPAGFSDHRMTVTDWNIITTTATTINSSSSSSSMTEAATTTTPAFTPVITPATTNANANADAATTTTPCTPINKTFIFNGLPPKRHHAWAYSKNNSDSTASISSLISTDTDSSSSISSSTSSSSIE
jgi:endonuclease/exonuclease/phosphatase family metal-dependent hydrolase